MLTGTEIDRALAHLDEHGWARLGRWGDDAAMAALRDRADAIMLAPTAVDGLFFQHDSPTGAYDDLTFGGGWIGPSPGYRKIERLERDPIFRAWIDDPRFAQVAHAAIGPEVALYRAVLWTKPATGGTELPWHQDGGKFWGLSAQPTLTIWTALDDVPIASGCVEVIPGSHRAGLATAEGGTIPDELVAPRLAEVIPLPATAGEVLLLHNLVWHRSRRNHTPGPRRALSLALMSADVRCTRRRRAPRTFTRLYSP